MLLDKKKIFIFQVILVLFFTGCSMKNARPTHEQGEVFHGTNEHTKVTDAIDKYTNTTTGGDCSGFITVLNSEFDNIYFDPNTIHKYFTKGRGKSQAIYNLYKKNDKLYFKNPKVGDLIFFQNTTSWTKGSINGHITHMGIIRDIEDGGRVKFVHNMRGYNKVSFMNRNKKDTYRVKNRTENSYIARCKRDDYSCLTSHRFAGYGRVDY